jgi:hypothetical protein
MTTPSGAGLAESAPLKALPNRRTVCEVGEVRPQADVDLGEGLDQPDHVVVIGLHVGTSSIGVEHRLLRLVPGARVELWDESSVIEIEELERPAQLRLGVACTALVLKDQEL